MLLIFVARIVEKRMVNIGQADMNELYHHGVLGQKWGIRRFQNEDGSRTNEGLQHLRETRAEEKYKRVKREGLISRLRNTTKNINREIDRYVDPETKALLKGTAISIGTSVALRYGGQRLASMNLSASGIGKRLALTALKSTPRLTVSAIRTTGSAGVTLMKTGSNMARTGLKIAVK